MTHLSFQSIIWKKNSMTLLDQRKLPGSKEFIEVRSLEETILAIRQMIVRGAPAIAMAGLYGMVLYLKSQSRKPSFMELTEKRNLLLESRPTAVNLRLALEKLFLNFFDYASLTNLHLIEIAEDEADELFKKDLSDNLAIAHNALKLFTEKKELSILTHCNTGALATAGHGTAIGILRTLRDSGFKLTVYAGETRPYHQGSRLTSWELMQEGIDCYIIADSMAGWLCHSRKIDAVIVGADRIAPNGDTANKIGTYSLSIIAKEHSVPFYVAATKVSFDFTIRTGEEITIEMRPEEELTRNSFLKDSEGKYYIPEGVLSPIGAKALNPGFDVTPAKNISAIVTEKGIISPVNEENVRLMME
ncbi:MAG: S-methyl-5-thioribose-1-phosphate isomerase [Leptospira sp.]|nr:S-methyl-5-thioribose-1-phosphate isomerase [Leptospira sp.]